MNFRPEWGSITRTKFSQTRHGRWRSSRSGGVSMHSSLNHIFRTIWSEVLGAWIAVSELTKTRGKRSGSSQTQVFRLDAGHR
ncbi:MAG: ESPR domain-containing protein, partial [Gammaproteobacteria bacterium]|nr:ESPR domain-containing protein [Gammaproteobacteria bacterium]